MVAAALAALLLQGLAPPGYMPGSLASGWPVVLCPEGLPKGFLGGGHHHGHHQGHHPAHHQGSGHGADHDPGLGEHCPLGGMLDGAALSSTAVVGGDGPLFAGDPSDGYLAPALARRTSAHRTRAPPRTV